MYVKKKKAHCFSDLHGPAQCSFTLSLYASSFNTYVYLSYIQTHIPPCFHWMFKCTLTSELFLYRLLPFFFLKISTWIALKYPSGLCTNTTFSVRTLVTTPCKTALSLLLVFQTSFLSFTISFCLYFLPKHLPNSDIS